MRINPSGINLGIRTKVNLIATANTCPTRSLFVRTFQPFASRLRLCLPALRPLSTVLQLSRNTTRLGLTCDLRHIYDRNHGRPWKPHSPDHPLRLGRRIRFRRLPGLSPLPNILICSPLADHKTDTLATDVRLDQRPRRPRKEKDGEEECQVLKRWHAGWSQGDQ